MWERERERKIAFFTPNGESSETASLHGSVYYLELCMTLFCHIYSVLLLMGFSDWVPFSTFFIVAMYIGSHFLYVFKNLKTLSFLYCFKYSNLLILLHIVNLLPNWERLTVGYFLFIAVLGERVQTSLLPHLEPLSNWVFCWPSWFSNLYYCFFFLF